MFKRKRASYNEALAETQTIRRVCWWYPSIKNVLEGYTTLWWKTALTDGCKRSLMHLSLWILLIMAKIEIFHRQRPPWPSLYLSTGLEDRRSHWHVLMHSFSCQDAQNICDDKMWCWMYTEAGMTLQCPGVGGRGRSPLIIGCPLASAYTPYTCPFYVFQLCMLTRLLHIGAHLTKCQTRKVRIPSWRMFPLQAGRHPESIMSIQYGKGPKSPSIT